MIYLPAIIAVVVSAAMVPVSMWLARKIHVAPTPRLGDIAIIAGTLCGILGTLGYAFSQGEPIADDLLRKLIAICGAGTFIFFLASNFSSSMSVTFHLDHGSPKATVTDKSLLICAVLERRQLSHEAVQTGFH